MPRTPDNVAIYLSLAGRIIREAALRHSQERMMPPDPSTGRM